MFGKDDTPVCFYVPEVEKEELEALKQVYAGEASSYQQRLALSVIVNKFSRAHDMQFVPGAPDQSAVLTGRAFVGSRILWALNMKIGELQNKESKQ